MRLRPSLPVAVLLACGWTGCGGGGGPAEGSGDSVEKPDRKATCIMGALPATLALDESVSAVAVADVDGDGCRDIAGIGHRAETDELQLHVAWGAADDPWRSQHDVLLAEAPSPGVGEVSGLGVRDSSSSVVDIGDWDGDGLLDVATASGVAMGGPERALEWRALPGDGVAWMPLPAKLADLDGDGRLELIRGTAAGAVERCTAADGCQPLAPAGQPFPVTELVLGDFDRDGALDVMAGRDLEEDVGPDGSLQVRAWLWESSGSFASPRSVDGLHIVDIEVGDVDGDGFVDLVSQVLEFISDFPSTTEVWLAAGADFTKQQTFGNSDNHNDAAALADVDGDGCLDYLQIGVDIPAIGLRMGSCSGSFAEGEALPSPTGIGVQVLDADGDGAPELVVRDAHGAGLHFLRLSGGQ